MTVKQLKELLSAYTDDDIVVTNGIKIVRKNTPGGVYTEHAPSLDGQTGGCGTSKNGMFRGDCKNCDHLDCSQCNWTEEK
ncbi:MAG: hypothetical protein E7612_03645 [Ruminococcaceae bacterium]|nr:hypothetical protein [Oscillospiraceae bacterium]